MNGVIMRAGLFDHVFVQPAAHDAGGALGAAWSVAFGAQQPTKPRRTGVAHMFLGSDVGNEHELEAVLDRWLDWVEPHHSEDIAATAASIIAEGEVVGWIQGRSEFGPRALGHRSIVADPRPLTHREQINALVKKREAYRPFAPAVLEERFDDYFEAPCGHRSHPFMVTVVHVKPKMAKMLAAVTHIDRTARVQTVTRTTNPLFWQLIYEFGLKTGVSVVLNTSFNNFAEPIVDSAEDALICFLTTGLQYLALGPYMVRKRPLSADDRRRLVTKLTVAVPPSYRLTVQRTASDRIAAGHPYRLEHVKSDYFGRSVDLSESMFRVLSRADGRRTTEQLSDVAVSVPACLADELLNLWELRMVTLDPTCGHQLQ
jgi:carbamoyltransferase